MLLKHSAENKKEWAPNYKEDPNYLKKKNLNLALAGVVGGSSGTAMAYPFARILDPIVAAKPGHSPNQVLTELYGIGGRKGWKKHIGKTIKSLTRSADAWAPLPGKMLQNAAVWGTATAVAGMIANSLKNKQIRDWNRQHGHIVKKAAAEPKARFITSDSVPNLHSTPSVFDSIKVDRTFKFKPKPGTSKTRTPSGKQKLVDGHRYN